MSWDGPGDGAEIVVPAPGLKLIGLIPGSGYGNAACEYAAGLSRIGLGVSWFPTRDNSAELLSLKHAMRDVPPVLSDCLRSLWNQEVSADALLLDVPPYRWHQYWLQAEPDLRPYCYLAWEVDKVPPAWLESINRFHKVFVPSFFNREAFIAGGITAPVEIIPHVAREFMPANSAGAEIPLAVNIPEDDFLFYTIGAWTTRKNLCNTVRAYLDAFTADDPVCLLIKTEPVNQIERYRWRKSTDNDQAPPQLGTAWAVARLLSSYPRAARIHLVNERLDQAQIDALHKRGSCFISLAHSEGWGLGAFDAAACGNPVIITGWGGQIDYLGKDYPWLVDYKLHPTDQYDDDGYFHRGPDVHWAEPDREQATALMRHFFAGGASVERVAKAVQARTKARYSGT